MSPLRKVISLKTTTIKNGKNTFFFTNLICNDIELCEKKIHSKTLIVFDMMNV